MKDAYDTNLDNINDDAEYFRSKAKAPKIMPDGYYHLSNGKVLDTAGNAVDSFDISNVAINDWYDDDLEKMVKKQNIKKALPSVQADGLMHVMQKGVDRAYDPVDFHEVSDDTETQLSPEAWIEESIAEDEKKAAAQEQAKIEAANRKTNVKKIMPDGFVHVTQNGKDRAFDPNTGKEVNIEPIFD